VIDSHQYDNSLKNRIAVCGIYLTHPFIPIQKAFSKDGPRKKLRKENFHGWVKNEINVTAVWQYSLLVSRTIARIYSLVVANFILARQGNF
jgi:hypothetical protein